MKFMKMSNILVLVASITGISIAKANENSLIVERSEQNEEYNQNIIVTELATMLGISEESAKSYLETLSAEQFNNIKDSLQTKGIIKSRGTVVIRL